MSNIFISYHHKSKAIVRNLANDIKALGPAVWFDQELTGGQAWWDHILEEIRACDLFIFALTEEALDSKPCMDEFRYAAGLGKPILPILIAEGIRINQLPPALSAIQIVDHREQDRNAALSLAKAISTTPPAKPLPDPLPKPPEVPVSYLGRIREEIDSTLPLSSERQSAIVLELKGSLREPESANDARALLERMRKRRDLLATIGKEIDEIIPQKKSWKQRLYIPLIFLLRSMFTWKFGALFLVGIFAAIILIIPTPLDTPTPEAPANSLTTSKTITNSIGMKFVLIPAGTFNIGSPTDEQGRDSDEMQHEVTITKPFYLQTTEVTQGQWKTVMRSNPSHFSGCGDDCPVERVLWVDVQAFIRRLNHQEGIDKYRLPTEAEWEYACRAGSITRFFYGNDAGQLGKHAWFGDNSNSRPHPVGQKKPNAWGLYDMHGNVWEWCEDRYDDYPPGEVIDPRGPPEGSFRVSRGGGWESFASNCRSANRIFNPPGDHNGRLGFRLSRSVALGP